MAYNVLGNWRFAVANKGLRSKTSNREMWWKKIAQRAQPDCNFLEPDRLKGGSSYRLLCAVPAYATLSYYQTIYLVFYKTIWLSYTLRW